ncbi:MAG: hypothetical protein IT239_05565 [Bacteroidia bacterium]|nr:hypothetical protein [Bacteroidia bacterium]
MKQLRLKLFIIPAILLFVFNSALAQVVLIDPAGVYFLYNQENPTVKQKIIKIN